jgi:hypothetical protein
VHPLEREEDLREDNLCRPQRQPVRLCGPAEVSRLEPEDDVEAVVDGVRVVVARVAAAAGVVVVVVAVAARALLRLRAGAVVVDLVRERDARRRVRAVERDNVRVLRADARERVDFREARRAVRVRRRDVALDRDALAGDRVAAGVDNAVDALADPLLGDESRGGGRRLALRRREPRGLCGGRGRERVLLRRGRRRAAAVRASPLWRVGVSEWKLACASCARQRFFSQAVPFGEKTAVLPEILSVMCGQQFFAPQRLLWSGG